jgi:hypothetical protein
MVVAFALEADSKPFVVPVPVDVLIRSNCTIADRKKM